jgi:hypothetical protein
MKVLGTQRLRQALQLALRLLPEAYTRCIERAAQVIVLPTMNGDSPPPLTLEGPDASASLLDALNPVGHAITQYHPEKPAPYVDYGDDSNEEDGESDDHLLDSDVNMDDDALDRGIAEADTEEQHNLGELEDIARMALG